MSTSFKHRPTYLQLLLVFAILIMIGLGIFILLQGHYFNQQQAENQIFERASAIYFELKAELNELLASPRFGVASFDEKLAFFKDTLDQISTDPFIKDSAELLLKQFTSFELLYEGWTYAPNHISDDRLRTGLLDVAIALDELGEKQFNAFHERETRLINRIYDLQIFVLMLIIGLFLSLGILIFLLLRSNQHSLEKQVFLERSRDRLKRHAIQFRVSATIAHDVSLLDDANEILKTATKKIQESFGYYAVSIYMRDEADQVHLSAFYGDTAPLTDQFRNEPITIALGEGIIGHVLETVEYYYAPNLEVCEISITHADLKDVKSELAVPLAIGEKAFGVLDVKSRLYDAFDADDIEIFKVLGDLIAVAVDKTRLKQQVEAHAEQMESLVAERTRSLSLERAQSQAILDAMTEGVVFSVNGKTEYINPVMTQLTGYVQDDFPGLLDLLDQSKTPYGDVTGLYRLLFHMPDLGNSLLWHGNLKFIRKDHSEFDADVTCIRIENHEHDIGGVVTIVRDITREKTLLDQKSQFLANASHELRTPLTNLKTRIYLIQRQPEKAEEHFAVLDQVIVQMQYLIDDLLERFRMERGLIHIDARMENMQSVLRQVIEIQQEEALRKDQNIVLNMPKADIMVWMDRNRIIQVITNLIINAINYTPVGGDIWVDLKHLENERVEILVRDTGIGIPRELQEYIFQPFFRASEGVWKGTGLGLNIARQIIELHGGTITVTSNENEGSIFRIILNMNQIEIQV